MVPIATGRAERLEAFELMPALFYRYRGKNGIGGQFFFDRVVASHTLLSDAAYPSPLQGQAVAQCRVQAVGVGSAGPRGYDRAA